MGQITNGVVKYGRTLNLGDYNSKRADAEIIVDKYLWDEMTHRQRLALIDHEITHLEFQKDEDGYLKTDDLGRPKLKLRRHDFCIEGFSVIARRYGEDSNELILARSVQKNFPEALDVQTGLYAK